MVQRRKLKRCHAGEVGPPAAKYHAVNSNRQEVQDRLHSDTNYDASILKPRGGIAADASILRTRNAPLKIGTWNVRTLFQAGKFDNLLQEMKEMRVDILGISETRWTEEGMIDKKDYKMVYSGGSEHSHGVGIVMSDVVPKSLIGYWPVSDRIIMCKFKASPFDLTIV
ncbi:craniofacial development protein 2-like [Elysia marginata]|uniref:Craniofacial development protein 2-like n=1 Tax=Elysia marginata TaxID=1093978 RepID=A0AAV4JEJ5_9GAST|nr:craniofacial development protein 2-like [Elysia marginata]